MNQSILVILGASFKLDDLQTAKSAMEKKDSS